jgi:hypothetical protein
LHRLLKLKRDNGRLCNNPHYVDTCLHEPRAERHTYGDSGHMGLPVFFINCDTPFGDLVTIIVSMQQ